jgi:glycerol dehydrogenase-like iron-containing ADH family enzyme
MRAGTETHFGTELIESLEFHPRRTVFVTMELPWKLTKPRLQSLPQHVAFVQSMERAILDEAANTLPPIDTVIGVGGGSALDFAKYLAWKRDLRLILIPSIVSVDACVTHSVGVRDEGRVHYVGHVKPERLLVDFNLIREAPPRLNRAGAGDVLSIHTGSFDWLLGHTKDGERYDRQVAQRCAELLLELERNAAEISRVSDKGIRTLVELFEAENDLCEGFGSSRPEEGSEHFFAYNAELRTGRHFVHGEIVCLGILLMSRLQENRPEWVMALLEDLGVLYRPPDIGLEPGELRASLSTLAAFCRQEDLPYTIIREALGGPNAIDTLISDLLETIPDPEGGTARHPSYGRACAERHG